jgi:hypothetical protein
MVFGPRSLLIAVVLQRFAISSVVYGFAVCRVRIVCIAMVFVIYCATATHRRCESVPDPREPDLAGAARQQSPDEVAGRVELEDTRPA